jgi:hypothetical protein
MDKELASAFSQPIGDLLALLCKSLLLEITLHLQELI